MNLPHKLGVFFKSTDLQVDSVSGWRICSEDSGSRSGKNIPGTWVISKDQVIYPPNMVGRFVEGTILSSIILYIEYIQDRVVYCIESWESWEGDHLERPARPSLWVAKLCMTSCSRYLQKRDIICTENHVRHNLEVCESLKDVLFLLSVLWNCNWSNLHPLPRAGRESLRKSSRWASWCSIGCWWVCAPLSGDKPQRPLWSL